jgi:hypothetical protein
MPIEVRELVIRATVEQDNGRSTGTRASGNSSAGGDSNDCLTKMEEIKKLIQEKNER